MDVVDFLDFYAIEFQFSLTIQGFLEWVDCHKFPVSLSDWLQKILHQTQT